MPTWFLITYIDLYIWYRYLHPDVCLHIREINESNDARDRREELLLFILEGTHTTYEVYNVSESGIE